MTHNARTTIYSIGFAAAVLSLTALARDAYQQPTELFCLIAESGSALNCQYFDGKESRALRDQDIPGFIDRASVNAYVSVKSRKGLDRTFLIDANSPSFKKLADIKQKSSVSEISRAKLEIFGEIEKRSIKISNDLDVASNTVDLIKADPSISNDKHKLRLTALTSELADTKATCSATAASSKDKAGKGPKCATASDMAIVSEDNRVLSRLMTSLLTAFQSEDSCLGDVKLDVGKDGSVDLGQVELYSKLFQKYCKRNFKPNTITKSEVDSTRQLLAADAAARVNAAKTAANDPTNALAVMLASQGKRELDVGNMKCDTDFAQGPFLITANSCGKTALCYGLANCSVNGGKKEKTRVTCEATMNGDQATCPQPTACLQSNSVMLWSKNIKVSGSKY